MLRRFENGKNDTLEILHHVVIGEAEDAIAAGGEPFVALGIPPNAGLEIVTFAIDFNDKLAGMCDEVGNVIAHGDLPPKAEAAESIRFEMAP